MGLAGAGGGGAAGALATTGLGAAAGAAGLTAAGGGGAGLAGAGAAGAAEEASTGAGAAETGLGKDIPGARRVTEGAAAMGRFFDLKRANAETRLLVGGAIEPSSWTLRVSASVLRTPGSALPFALTGFLAAAAGAFTAFFLAAGALGAAGAFFFVFFSISLF